MVTTKRIARDIIEWLLDNGYDPASFPVHPVLKNAIRATRGYDIRTFDKVRKVLTDTGHLELVSTSMAKITETPLKVMQ